MIFFSYKKILNEVFGFKIIETSYQHGLTFWFGWFGLGQEYSLDDVCETLYGPNFQFRRFPYLGVCSYLNINCFKVEISSYNFFMHLINVFEANIDLSDCII